MILFAAGTIKVLVALIIMYAGWYFFRKKLTHKNLLFLTVSVIIFALAANMLSSRLPPLTDRITLTALGEQRSESQGSEVYLAGYTIDKKEYISGKSLEIVEGHWFWSGETYAWRPKTDVRQPEGITRTVVLEIPVGWSRTLDFDANPWRGIVEINNGAEIWTADTYFENSSIVPVEVGRSETSSLILNQIRYLGLYTAVLLMLSAFVALVLHKVLKKPESAKSWMGKKSGKLIYAGIALGTMFLMVYYAGNFSFWLDELFQIESTKGSIVDAIKCCLTFFDQTPPLPDIIGTIWYHIAPYGEQWLLLVSIVPTVGAVYLMGVIGERLQNKYCGALAAIMMAFSTTVWLNVAYEYRGYAFTVFFSALTLYCYIRRNEKPIQKKWILCFALAMTGMAMSHYFGMIACALYFLPDCYLFIKKHITVKEGAAYLLPGGVSVIWLAAAFRVTLQYHIPTQTWYANPNIACVTSLLQFLSGYCEISYLFLLLGIAGAISYLYSQKIKSDKSTCFYRNLLVMMIISTILMMVVYGRFINTESTLWTERYFIFLIPAVCMLSAYAAYDIIALLALSRPQKIIQRAGCLFFGFFLCLNCVPRVVSAQSTDPYREAADWIYMQSNYVFNEDTLIISTNQERIAEAWSEYYITRQGRRDPLHIESQQSITQEDILQHGRIYISYIHEGITSYLQNILNENYTLEADLSGIRMLVYVRK